MMRNAVDDDLIAKTPCKVIGAATEHAAERPIATILEIEALSLAVPSRLRLLIELATWCQLRRGELLGLQRNDVDLMHETIRITRSRNFRRDGSSLTKSPKTASGTRTLSMPPNVLASLTNHLDHFVSSDEQAVLFTSQSGTPLSATSLQRAWSKARLSIGRPELHMHDLRHTGLTLAAATGATTAELMHRAGHASASASLRYQHATRDRDQVLAIALANLATVTKVSSLRVTEPTGKMSGKLL
jgi:integrase